MSIIKELVKPSRKYWREPNLESNAVRAAITNHMETRTSSLGRTNAQVPAVQASFIAFLIFASFYQEKEEYSVYYNSLSAI